MVSYHPLDSKAFVSTCFPGTVIDRIEAVLWLFWIISLAIQGSPCARSYTDAGVSVTSYEKEIYNVFSHEILALVSATLRAVLKYLTLQDERGEVLPRLGTASERLLKQLFCRATVSLQYVVAYLTQPCQRTKLSTYNK